jgi:dTDP-4-dehydrorhamnose reductase
VPLLGRKVEALKMSELSAFVARRPVYTVLGTGKLTALIGGAPRKWQDAVEDYVIHFFAKKQ